MVITNLHLLDKKSLFSRKNDKTPAKLVVRDVRDIKEHDCKKKNQILKNGDFTIFYPSGLSPRLRGGSHISAPRKRNAPERGLLAKKIRQ